MRPNTQVLLLLLLRGRNASSFISKSIGNYRKHSTLTQSKTHVMKMSSSSTTTTNGEDKERRDVDEQLIFGKFKISSEQIFYNSPSNLSAAIVNLRPIVPGHVLVIPTRIVPLVSQLNTEEYVDLWESVRKVQSALEKCYNAQGFNIAIQDGKAAGQSVPHVHVHILPRIANDFERNDDIYDELEDWAPTDDMSLKKRQDKEKNGNQLEVPDDLDRRDRTMEEMENEAVIYRKLLASIK